MYGGNNFDDVIQRAQAFVDEADWLTSEYFIDSIREEHPALASLFLGWPDARTWLDIQTENLRQRFANAGKPIPAPTPTSQPAPRTTTRSADSEPSTESAELTEPPLQFDKSPTSET
jgi:hypothetical protein